MRDRFLAALFTMLLYSGHFAASQVPQGAPSQPQTSNPKAEPARQPSQIVSVAPITTLKKAVAFITVSCRNHTQALQVRGTGFFVFVPDSRVGENGGFAYLVTNRHVIEPEKDGVKLTVTGQSVRLNIQMQNVGEGSEDATIPLSTHWFFPKDPAVDLAVLPLAPDQKRFDYQPLPITVFATREVISDRKNC